MAMEIERKYRVHDTAMLSGMEGESLTQGYLNESGMTTRVRLAGGKRAWLTLKGRAEGISRAEFEYEIPFADGVALLAHCGNRVVAKTRYHVPVGDHVWDVDVYEGPLSGLVTAEVELACEDEPFERPSWLGEDISLDGRYTNEALARAGRLPAA